MLFRAQFPAPLDTHDAACVAELRERWGNAGLKVTTTTAPTSLSIMAVRYRRFVKDLVTGVED